MSRTIGAHLLKALSPPPPPPPFPAAAAAAGFPASGVDQAAARHGHSDAGGAVQPLLGASG
jgi:hypothetical protein